MGESNLILIVDDMEINRLILAEYFKADFTIIEAEEGKEALDIVRKYKNNIKMILLDKMMPNMNGFQVLEVLEKEGLLNVIPVILVTGDYSVEEAERGYALGISEIILKPFEPIVIKKRVQNIIELYQYKKM